MYLTRVAATHVHSGDMEDKIGRCLQRGIEPGVAVSAEDDEQDMLSPVLICLRQPMTAVGVEDFIVSGRAQETRRHAIDLLLRGSGDNAIGEDA